MFYSLDKYKKLKVGWNERSLTEADFHRLCRLHKVTVQELPLRVSGFYYSMLGGHFIAIDSKLPPRKKLFVMFHEFAHFLMHAPDQNLTASYHGVGRQTRKEREADVFALVALIPKVWLETRAPDEMVRDEGVTADELAARYALFETYGV
jgi:Zn-dependent peptidase ImmA (M78 family)